MAPRFPVGDDARFQGEEERETWSLWSVGVPVEADHVAVGWDARLGGWPVAVVSADSVLGTVRLVGGCGE